MKLRTLSFDLGAVDPPLSDAELADAILDAVMTIARDRGSKKRGIPHELRTLMAEGLRDLAEEMERGT